MNQINPSENLARYIFTKSQFSPLRQAVKYSAFVPPQNKRLSVFRISGISENEIWQIGEGIGYKRSLPLLARADIKAVSVIETGLSFDADNIPPCHASIIGWPEEASAIKLKAIELAEKALLKMR